jgi:hypothetical protein
VEPFLVETDIAEISIFPGAIEPVSRGRHGFSSRGSCSVAPSPWNLGEKPLGSANPDVARLDGTGASLPLKKTSRDGNTQSRVLYPHLKW